MADDQTPYVSTATTAEPVRGLEYFREYSYIFESPSWGLNVLFGAICILSTSIIPVVGQLIFLGYTFDIVESLHRRRDRGYPDFNFDRLMQYLVRGAWPFLVSLVAAVVVIPVVMLLFGVVTAAIMAVGSVAGEDAASVTAVLAMILGFAGFVALVFLIWLVALPMMLRAGLSQDLKEGFNFEFIRDFVGRVWVETLLACLFISVTSLVAMLAGIAFFCVGLYAAIAIVMLAQAHLYYQLYELYLSRGGMQIPLKEPEVPDAPLR